ncbi:MAG: response regulator transcription factor [Bacteroidota bacterium]
MQRLVIAAYNPIIVEGIKKVLDDREIKLDIVGEATSISDFLDLLELQSPDLAIVDVALTWRSGLDFVEEVGKRNRWVKIIPISVHPIDQQVLKGIKRRANNLQVTPGWENILSLGLEKLN